MTVATQTLEGQRATRNGEPAYRNAPPRKTQAMYDLERRLAARRAEFRALQNAAEQCDEPRFRIALATVLLAIATWLIVIAVGSVLL